ncbi:MULTISPECIES: hypothetical protein [unclassified Microbacterium]|uniref:hypothetical protein n=1 Tax=unclassified Microbacterium TaxID=2609290 RepID=UPI0010F6C1AC|nr:MULTISPECIES: hypothetical protein [unclassified Microbacterium]
MSLLAFADAVDIGGGRGRLAAPAAASLARVDAAFRYAFGRAADINEAWRSPEQADKNYRAYVAYLAGRGPWAALAYPAATSIHCRGYALDTDDTSTAHMRIWNEHGWFWTVYRNGKLIERWHLEYFPERDKHRGASAAGTTTPTPGQKAAPHGGKMVIYARRNDGLIVAIPEGGLVHNFETVDEYNRTREVIAFVNGQRQKHGQPLITLPPTIGELVDECTMNSTDLNSLIHAQGAESIPTPRLEQIAARMKAAVEAALAS